MTISQSILVMLAITTIVFNAGGFYWLANNHFKHVNSTLEELQVELGKVRESIARIEGRLQK